MVEGNVILVVRAMRLCLRCCVRRSFDRRVEAARPDRSARTSSELKPKSIHSIALHDGVVASECWVAVLLLLPPDSHTFEGMDGYIR